MSRSDFFDTHKPRPISQQQVDGAVAALFGGTDSRFTGGLVGGLTSKRRKSEELGAYMLYNYLAVTRIAMKTSQQFPMTGIVTAATDESQQSSRRFRGKYNQRTKRYSLSITEKMWLRRAYGNRIIQSVHEQEVEQLPATHPLIALFHHVNNVDWWESFAFEAFLFYQLTGEVFIWMVPSNFATRNSPGGMPVELWVIPTDWVGLNYDKDSGRLKSYTVTPRGNEKRKRTIPAEQILHHKYKNPHDKNRGYSPSSAGGAWLDANEAIEESRIRTFDNAITPSVWLKITKDADIGPKDPILDKIKERWMQRAAGLKHHREPQVIPPGMEIDSSGNLTPKEMDYNNSAPEIRDNILALRGVNKFVAGFTESMNRAQVETALVHFCEIVINPELRMFAGALQERLASRFDSRIRVWFNDCTPESRELMLDEAKFLWSIGGLRPNEGRAIFNQFGLAPVDDPDYDTGYLPGGLVPLGGNPSMELPDEDEDEESMNLAEEMYNGNGKSNGTGAQSVEELLDRISSRGF